MAKTVTIKEAKTLEVKIGDAGSGHIVQFRFEDDKATGAEVSFDGKTWHDVEIVHKAMAAFVDRYPFEFADE